MKMLFHQLILDAIVSGYLVANTPSYLYQRLRQIRAIQNLPLNTPSEELISEFRKVTSQKPGSVDEIATAYAILAAITFLDYPKALQVLSTLDLSKLDWGQDFRDIFVKNSRATNVFDLRISPFSQPLILQANSSTRIIPLEQQNSSATQD